MSETLIEVFIPGPKGDPGNNGVDGILLLDELGVGVVEAAATTAVAAAPTVVAAAAAAVAGVSVSSIIQDYLSKSTDLGVMPTSTINVVEGTYELDLTGDVIVNYTGTLDLTLIVHGGGSVTVGNTEYAITQTSIIFAIKSTRGAIYSFLVGGTGGIEADNTPPSAISGLTVGAITENTIAFSWLAGVDAESAVRYSFRYKPVGGAFNAWANTVSLSKTITGLQPVTSYVFEVYAFSAGGASATVLTATAATTEHVPVSGEVLVSDTFTGVADTDMLNRSANLALGGTARVWAATVGDWKINAAGRLYKNASGGKCFLSGGYAGKMVVEFDIVAAGPNLLYFQIGGSSTGAGGVLINIGATQLYVDGGQSDHASSITGYLAPAGASANDVLGHWKITLDGTILNFIRPDGYVYNGNLTVAAKVGTYFGFNSAYGTEGWTFDNVKVSYP